MSDKNQAVPMLNEAVPVPRLAYEQLLADAARYRWLRNDESKFGWQGKNGMTAEQIDAAIDASMDKDRMEQGFGAALEITKKAIK